MQHVENFDVLPGGLYALTQAEPGVRVVAWVRATAKQDWCPLGAFDSTEQDTNKAAAMDACRNHWKQQQRAQRGTSKF